MKIESPELYIEFTGGDYQVAEEGIYFDRYYICAEEIQKIFGKTPNRIVLSLSDEKSENVYEFQFAGKHAFDGDGSCYLVVDGVRHRFYSLLADQLKTIPPGTYYLSMREVE